MFVVFVGVVGDCFDVIHETNDGRVGINICEDFFEPSFRFAAIINNDIGILKAGNILRGGVEIVNLGSWRNKHFNINISIFKEIPRNIIDWEDGSDNAWSLGMFANWHKEGEQN